MLQRAAHQDMAVAARDGVAPLGQHHAGQEVLGALVEDHLPLHRLHRQRQPQAAQQLAAPGAGGQHHGLRPQLALGGTHALDPPRRAEEIQHLAVLPQGDIGQTAQGFPQRPGQARIAHIGHIRHVHGARETLAQHRHRLPDRGDIHLVQGTPVGPGPLQRLGLIVQVQPVQPGDMHLGIDAGVRQQALAQLRVEVLRPVGQVRHGAAVAPRIERGDDTATRPGGLAPRLAALQQRDPGAFLPQQPGTQQPDHSPTHNDHIRHASHLLAKGKTALTRAATIPTRFHY
ncbi:hypothetical protein D3C81_1022020 [compost metagenome]